MHQLMVLNLSLRLNFNVNVVAAAMGVVGAPRSTVFINEVAFEVAAGLLNVREAFGGEAILVDHSGQPVLTDEWGFTIHPLQHGASYYLVLSLLYIIRLRPTINYLWMFN